MNEFNTNLFVAVSVAISFSTTYFDRIMFELISNDETAEFFRLIEVLVNINESFVFKWVRGENLHKLDPDDEKSTMRNRTEEY